MDRGLIRVPYLHEPSVGLGLLAAAALVAAPAVSALLSLDPSLGLGTSDSLAGVPATIPLLVGAAILAIVGVLDLAGRRELRQGTAILALGGALVLGFLLVLTVRDALGTDGDPAAALARVPALLLPLWGSALALGTVGFGPTRTAVVIGLVMLAVSLLLPTPPDGKPAATWLFGLGPAGPVWVAAMFIVAAWRLLDLPWLGGLPLGVALIVGTVAVSFGVIEPGTATATEGMVAPSDVLALLEAAAIWIGLGAAFGRPPAGLAG